MTTALESFTPASDQGLATLVTEIASPGQVIYRVPSGEEHIVTVEAWNRDTAADHTVTVLFGTSAAAGEIPKLLTALGGPQVVRDRGRLQSIVGLPELTIGVFADATGVVCVKAEGQRVLK